VDRFLREARVAAGVGHENLVAVTDFGELSSAVVPGLGDVTLPYFVMDRLRGESLAELIRREPKLEPKRVAEIVRQCAEGLSAAHAAGVVHRDLKPGNVFLVRQGEREVVKLLDFGVAKILGASRLTKVGTVYGTPHYMSPEQASGQPVDARADIYAVGVILYECLAGKVPFSADTVMGVLSHHMFTEPPPLEEAAPDSPLVRGLAPIAMRCLAKKPEDRFESMRELAEALTRQLEGAEMPAPQATRLESDPELPMVGALPNWLSGRRWAWIFAIAGIGILAAAWFGLSSGGEAADSPDPTTGSSAVAPPTPPSAAVPPVSPTAAVGVEKPAPTPAASASSRNPAPGPRSGSQGASRRRPPRGSEIVDPWGD